MSIWAGMCVGMCTQCVFRCINGICILQNCHQSLSFVYQNVRIYSLCLYGHPTRKQDGAMEFYTRFERFSNNLFLLAFTPPPPLNYQHFTKNKLLYKLFYKLISITFFLSLFFFQFCFHFLHLSAQYRLVSSCHVIICIICSSNRLPIR